MLETDPDRLPSGEEIHPHAAHIAHRRAAQRAVRKAAIELVRDGGTRVPVYGGNVVSDSDAVTR